MDSLANDVLKEIFIKLPIIQKQQKWASLIRNNILLDTIAINFNPNAFERFIHYDQRQPHLAHQVANLAIDESITNKYDQRAFVSLVRNLKVLETGREPMVGLTREQPRTGHVNFALRKVPQLKHLEERSSYDLTKFLPSSPLPYLIQLTLNVSYINHEEYTKRVLSLLKNTLSLKKLNILNHRFTMDIFELVHDNTPSLEILNLTANAWFSSATEIPDVTSVASLKTLFIDLPKFQDKLSQRGYQRKGLEFVEPCFKILQHLKESKQIKCINSCTLHGTDSKIYGWINNMSSLKSLSFNYLPNYDDANNPGIWKSNLARLCQYCPPTLKSISAVDTLLKQDVAYSQQFPMIKKFTVIGMGHPYEHACQFISRCLPNLDTLCLDVRKYSDSQSPIFLFTDRHLPAIELKLERNSSRIVKLVTSEKNEILLLDISYY